MVSAGLFAVEWSNGRRGGVASRCQQAPIAERLAGSSPAAAEDDHIGMRLSGRVKAARTVIVAVRFLVVAMRQIVLDRTTLMPYHVSTAVFKPLY